MRNHLIINRLESCIFKRFKGSKWEKGILINDGDFKILDNSGKPLIVYDYKKCRGFRIDVDLDSIKDNDVFDLLH